MTDLRVATAVRNRGLPTLDRSRYAADGLRCGAYVLSDSVEGAPDLILIATGSEVGLIVAAAERLQAQGVAVRCVSMASWELFEALPQAQRDAVLPPSVRARLAVEAGVAQGWHRYVGDAGDVPQRGAFWRLGTRGRRAARIGVQRRGGLSARVGVAPDVTLKGSPSLRYTTPPRSVAVLVRPQEACESSNDVD